MVKQSPIISSVGRYSTDNSSARMDCRFCLSSYSSSESLAVTAANPSFPVQQIASFSGAGGCHRPGSRSRRGSGASPPIPKVQQQQLQPCSVGARRRKNQKTLSRRRLGWCVSVSHLVDSHFRRPPKKSLVGGAFFPAPAALPPPPPLPLPLKPLVSCETTVRAVRMPPSVEDPSVFVSRPVSRGQNIGPEGLAETLFRVML